MKKIIFAAFAASAMFAVPAVAAPNGGAGNTVAGQNGWTKSENANANACFGQARAAFASDIVNPSNGGSSNGSYISDRKGTNPDNNAEFIETYCALVAQ
jgi:hypothetical protein